MISWIPFGCLPFVVLIGLVVLFPIMLADLMATALGKLGLGAAQSLLVMLAMLAGGLVNIPVRKIPRVLSVDAKPPGLYGFERLFPGLFRESPYTVIAVNVGGCVIPCAIVAYELVRIASRGPAALWLTLLAVLINAAVCFRLARPVPNVGIALPAIIPALVSAASAYLLVRDFAPPVAFTAGVLGTLIGADILHLRSIGRISTGMASIGGAGTFDGIVLSGLAATLLS